MTTPDQTPITTLPELWAAMQASKNAASRGKLANRMERTPATSLADVLLKFNLLHDLFGYRGDACHSNLTDPALYQSIEADIRRLVDDPDPHIMEDAPLSPGHLRAFANLKQQFDKQSDEIGHVVALLRYLAALNETTEPDELHGTFNAVCTALGKVHMDLDGVIQDMESYAKGEIVFPLDPDAEKGGAS